MITEFNRYEMAGNVPKVGDYVICGVNDKNHCSTAEKEFIYNKIGKIININNSQKYNYYTIYITYDNIPWGIYDGDYNDLKYIKMNISSIKYFSKDREELESILNTNKFNI
jgi:hypothetical protein